MAVTGVLWWGAPGALGQGPRWQSHGPIPGDSHLKPTTLADRLKMAQGLTDAQELLQKTSGNPTFLQQFLKDLDLNDPKQQALLEELVRAAERQRIQLDPHHPLVKELEKLVNPPGGAPPAFPGIKPELAERLKNLLPKSPSEAASGSASGPGNAGQPNEVPATVPATGAGGNAPTPPEAMTGPDGLPRELEDPLRNSQVGRWVLRQLQDSPELRDTVESLLRFRPGAGAGRDGLANTLGDKVVGQVRRYLPEPSFWTDKVLPKLPRVSLPALPKLRLPEVHVNPPALPSVPLPRVSLPSGGRAGYSWLVLPVCLGLGLIAWKVLRGRQPSGGLGRLGPHAGWVLGPWPVAPAAVSSETELIQAFEYLTLLKLGPDARSWNHRVIAAGLGGGNADQRLAAEQLAGLYERCRYAPVHEPLAADVLGAARRALAFLAGGTPA